LLRAVLLCGRHAALQNRENTAELRRITTYKLEACASSVGKHAC
jgi:hypothetical protein